MYMIDPTQTMVIPQIEFKPRLFVPGSLHSLGIDSLAFGTIGASNQDPLKELLSLEPPPKVVVVYDADRGSSTARSIAKIQDVASRDADGTRRTCGGCVHDSVSQVICKANDGNFRPYIPFFLFFASFSCLSRRRRILKQPSLEASSWDAASW